MNDITTWQFDKVLKAGDDECRMTLPQVTDISGQEGIRLMTEVYNDGLCEIEVTLYPLFIARPEFFPSIKGRITIGKGIHEAEIPFEQFEFRQMVRAFLNYLDGISVRVLQGGPVRIKSVSAGIMGDFSVCAERSSMFGETVKDVTYSFLLSNKSPGRRIINVHQMKYGKECLPAEYAPCVVLEADENKQYEVKVRMTEDIPEGGMEKSVFHFVPDGIGTMAKKVTLYTCRARRHPYLFLQEAKWQERKAAIMGNKRLWEAFVKKYLQTADEWEVPEVSGQEDYVYPSYSQNPFFYTAVAWKITGEDKYLQKVMQYLTDLLDDRNGYLATGKSYFVFIENAEEYSRGDFKVCRAQNAGWVQEAEFFNKIAVGYDLLYEYFTPRQHECMEACLRNYMRFAGWRLTDGDGNNFQLAETAAGLLCAMVLQDHEMVMRFLHGYNGYLDLLSAVFLDDGMYFEEAGGYTRLAGELCFDIVNAAENFGISLKDIRVPASFDRYILHAPWAMRETWAEDGKPFLGMSFQRFEQFTKPGRSLRDYFDCTAKLLSDKGIMFSVNDSNEMDFTELYKKAYYLYKVPLYKKIAGLSDEPELLFVPGEEAVYEPGKQSVLLPAAGMGILRDSDSQAVLKFGVHGGYHGHFDRLSLASFLKEGRTFHNNKYAWYGYDSFLFKMWVQTSMAHNMTVVDGRMQKPSPCRCIYFAEKEDFSAVCAQTVTEWIDPPYGGQTPYPYKFPEEKCALEGKYILEPSQKRRQGETGAYSESIFQRRLLILFHGYCIIWDYLEGRDEHRYDCLYHPMGRFQNENKIRFTHRSRFLEDPFGAGQFITNCHTAYMVNPVCLRFHDAQTQLNGNDIMENTQETAVWRAFPVDGDVTIGRYPQNGDSFTEENIKRVSDYLSEPLKKTVSFSVSGSSARFITLLETGKEADHIKNVCCEEYHSVIVEEYSGLKWKISVSGMDEITAEKIQVEADAI